MPLVLQRGALGFHVLQGLRLDSLHVLLGAVLLLIVQVALEKELHPLRGQAQMNDPLKDVPMRKNREAVSLGSLPCDPCLVPPDLLSGMGSNI